MLCCNRAATSPDGTFILSCSDAAEEVGMSRDGAWKGLKALEKRELIEKARNGDIGNPSNSYRKLHASIYCLGRNKLSGMCVVEPTEKADRKADGLSANPKPQKADTLYNRNKAEEKTKETGNRIRSKNVSAKSKAAIAGVSEEDIPLAGGLSLAELEDFPQEEDFDLGEGFPEPQNTEDYEWDESESAGPRGVSAGDGARRGGNSKPKLSLIERLERDLAKSERR